MIVLIASTAAALMIVMVGAAVGQRTVRAAAVDRLLPPTGSTDDKLRHRWERCVAQLAHRRTERSMRDVDASADADLLDSAARHCASGQSLTHAFAASVRSSPIAALFAPTSAALDAGQSVDEALEHQTTSQPHVALAVHAIRLCARQGGNISESLDRTATTLRDRATVTQERHAQSAQARLSARVLTVLPIGFGGWTIATTESVQRFVVTPAGVVCITVGLALNGTGWYSMSRVVRRAW